MLQNFAILIFTELFLIVYFCVDYYEEYIQLQLVSKKSWLIH